MLLEQAITETLAEHREATPGLQADKVFEVIKRFIDHNMNERDLPKRLDVLNMLDEDHMP